jgi:hypothetical protein
MVILTFLAFITEITFLTLNCNFQYIDIIKIISDDNYKYDLNLHAYGPRPNIIFD